MISVVIPIFNISQYLSQCMDSVLAQSYEDLDIILVDDGSTDDCPRMCDGYKEQDVRVKVIHKENGGLSDARNVGMKIAAGEWIYFVDSDDWVDRNAIQQLYNFAVENHCDVVQGGLYYAYQDHLLYRKASKKEQRRTVLERNDAMQELIINDRVKNFAWGKLYKKELIKDLEFPVGKYFEDSFWQHKVMDRVERYGIIDEPLYYYRQRQDSISGTPSTRLKDLLDGNRERMNFIREKYPELLPLMEKKYNALCEQTNPPTSLIYPFKHIIKRVFNILCVSSYKRIDIE